MKKLISDSDSNSEPSETEGTGGVLLAEVRSKLKNPPLYTVIMLNDDYTPMEFVVEILEQFFQKDRTAATQIMLTIHTKGKAVCGLYPKDIAETRSYAVNQYARESEHPLLCEIEPVNGDDDE